MRGFLAVFVLTLPILAVCIIAWVVGNEWIFMLMYTFVWFMAICMAGAFKLLAEWY